MRFFIVKGQVWSKVDATHWRFTLLMPEGAPDRAFRHEQGEREEGGK